MGVFDLENSNVGRKRMGVVAHYGLKDWLAQRITAIVMAIFTIVIFTLFLFSSNLSYLSWAGLFAQTWFKLLCFFTFLSLYYHVWVGVRDIWMDYIKPVSIRLMLQIFTILWLVGCAVWTVQILWRV